MIKKSAFILTLSLIIIWSPSVLSQLPVPRVEKAVQATDENLTDTVRALLHALAQFAQGRERDRTLTTTGPVLQGRLAQVEAQRSIECPPGIG